MIEACDNAIVVDSWECGCEAGTCELGFMDSNPFGTSRSAQFHDAIGSPEGGRRGERGKKRCRIALVHTGLQVASVLVLCVILTRSIAVRLEICWVVFAVAHWPSCNQSLPACRRGWHFGSWQRGPWRR
ncbi:hypothetical protein BU23DRAFT_211994 [Bimuria novae-zelandiae CBS 107.79]|uniref:Uncharacterized protein n=1 Tax=Bimuria novae-zelandiae CBS 107.79 TaxID=1447943 RepID=A0A6A5V2Z3_9PLEO|nr:hypothetical protein BU23DRAFT_211994 [Bimuria novae-zelandiae CBS 107.79]